jgi:hypothetical protein
VDGVVIGQAVSVAAKYGALPYTTVTLEYTPDAGYMVFDPANGLTINFAPHEPI